MKNHWRLQRQSKEVLNWQVGFHFNVSINGVVCGMSEYKPIDETVSFDADEDCFIDRISIQMQTGQTKNSSSFKELWSEDILPSVVLAAGDSFNVNFDGVILNGGILGDAIRKAKSRKV